ncbi:MAG: metallophosphoesterase [Candidatus Stygibacter australis]|nr:metallophosphoesterase [Candidatus Stygibacter australis]
MKKIIFAFIILTSIFCIYAKNDFHFAILGDRTGGANQEAFDEVINEINSLRPDFIINVGDFVEDGRIAGDWDVPLKSIEILDCKLYFVPGNHDIIDENSAQIFKEKTGFDPFYSFDYQKTHFVVLNNATISRYDEFDEEQVNWLIKDLNENRESENIFVFMHKPFWANQIASEKEDRFHEIFLQNNVDAVITGHWHQYAHNQYDGIDYYLVGSSGGSMPDENVDMGIFYQYMMCKVEDDELYTSLIKSGNIFSEDLVTIEEEQLSYNIPNSYITLNSRSDTEKRYFIEFSVINKTDKTINSDLIIESNDNWITPEKNIKLTINPGDTLKSEFVMENNKNMFPLPSVKFSYPFGRGKIYEYEKAIFIPRVVNCNYVKKIPKIDGKISEKDRAKAFIVNKFADNEAQLSEIDDSELFFLIDKEYLYIASITGSISDSLKASCTERDEEVYADDAIGFLLSGEDRVIYQFYVNTSGVIWDMKSDFNADSHDLEWNGNIEVKTRINDSNWIAEIKIPLAELNFENVSELNFNYCQYRQYEDSSLYFQPEWSYDSVKNGTIKIMK